MARKFRGFTKKFFLYANIVAVIVFLLACLVPYLNPQKWWFLSFLGLGFPFLLVVILLFLIGWFIIMKPKIALISALALLLSFKSITVFFAFKRKGSFTTEKSPGTLRIVSWNVARFIELKKNMNKGSQTRQKMFDLIKTQNADILCLQEFHTSIKEEYYNNIEAVQNELGYPYYFFSFDTDGDKHYYSSIIFSRYPIIDTGFVRYPRPTLPDVLLQADIKWNNDTVRVFTTHLQSLQFDKKDYESLSKIKNVEDSMVSGSKTIISKMKRGYTNRSIQAQIVDEIMSNSPFPKIFCGDLNDVPNSYAYFTVRGNMQDAFLKRSFGIGRTFSGISPTLRIDYIFADNDFRIKQFKRIPKKLSDHYMLVADIALEK